MPHPIPRRFVVARTVANAVLICLAFALVVPNCIVPANGTTPQHFQWAGLVFPFIISVIATYCLWFCR
jgi:hypothetical protein